MEENKQIELLAAFMGIYVDDIRKVGTLEFVGYLITDQYGNFDIEEPKYYCPDSDWNQLMPVVEKIESIKQKVSDSYGTYSVEMSKYGCKIRELHSQPIAEAIGDTKIESVIVACIDFIEWYNKQSKEPLPPLHPAYNELQKLPPNQNNHDK